jgi:hypothetical protein
MARICIAVFALSLVASVTAFADDLPDSTDPHTLTPSNIELKINDPITAQTVFGNPKDKHKASCTVKLGGSGSLDAPEELTVFDVYVSTDQHHGVFHSSSSGEFGFSGADYTNNKELDVACKFPNATFTLGDIRAVLNGAIQILAKP